MVTQGDQLSATGYLLSQAALLDEFAEGKEACFFGAYRTFQVPVRRIEASSLPREILRPQDIVV